jgi:uncharacterized protein (DUF433 family)
MSLEWHNYIEQRPGVMTGKPVFKGTRLTVEHVMRELGRGMNRKTLLASHPRLTPKHLRAAKLYAAAVLASGELL